MKKNSLDTEIRRMRAESASRRPLAFSASRRDWKGLALPGFILVALIGNAFICGVLSGPHDRYQSRLVWVPVFALILLARPWEGVALRRPIESVT